MTEVNHRCAVLGRPIAHSLSPVLHRAAYRALGLDDWAYDRHDVGEEDLDAFLRGLDPTWRGLSLTMPLKKTIQPYGTPANVWAERLGVANTAVFDWEHRRGDGMPAVRLYNTDVPGIVMAIGHAMELAGRSGDLDAASSAVVIGNGNTASSAVAALASMIAGRTNAHMTVAARRPGRNPDPARVAALGGCGRYDETTIDAAVDALRGADLAVSTIPGHAADAVAAAILADDGFHPRGVLLDVVYDPRPSALMKAWRGKGGLAVGGEEMLLYQAIAQAVLMTDPDGDDLQAEPRWSLLENAMRRALEEAL